ncbi:hypothetical protein ENSA5_27600 [Enhygromyxa salina]|uniref:Uncharacterized protein n=1 Tax=Enhygromyxa salina TaxID=215803 RepID=A0A2S9Y7I9_9BACT|nr:hypothetical protein [Enhygromyxa salina]PRQ01078.1 hypothetical protein ENSA5_27600 [Enhygromyxa salina]
MTKHSVLVPAVLAVIVGAGGLSGCFDSDELRSSNDGTTGDGGETVAIYSDESDEGGDDNWTAEDTGPAETTCRDAIECLITCQTIMLFNPQPEPDLSCFLECDKGLTTEEAYKLIKLAECIGNKCADEGACGPDASDQDCLTCIAGNGNDPEPEGCIEEAEACE